MSLVTKHVDEIVSECRSIGKRVREKLVIRQSPLEGRDMQLLMETVSQIEQENCSIECVFDKSRNYSVIDAVSLGLIDIGLIHAVPERVPDSVESIYVYEDVLHFWLHKDNPLANRSPLFFKDLEDCFLINSSNPMCVEWNDGTRGVCREHGFEPQWRIKDLQELYDYLSTQKVDEMLITDPVLGRFADISPILVDRIVDDKPSPCYPGYLVFRKAHKSTAVGTFISVFKEVCNEILRKPQDLAKLD